MPVSGQDGVSFNNFTNALGAKQPSVFVSGAGITSTDPHMRLTGVAGDEATSPSDTKYDVLATANFTVQVRVQLDKWSQAGAQNLIGRFAATASGTWRFAMTGGFPQMSTTANHSSATTSTSTVVVPARDGDTVWVRTVVVAGSSACSFSWAPDEPNPPTVWITLSTNRATAAFPLASSTDPIEVGARGTTLDPLAGRIYRARILDASAALVAEFNAADWPASSPWISSTGGESWSLVGGATVVSNVPIGTLAFTEDDDVVAMSGAEDISGTAAWVEDDDTITATGTETFTGTLSFTEDDDVWAAAGAENISGTLAFTEADDVIAASGTENISGTAAWTEDDDVVAASGAETITGILAFTEDDDVWALSAPTSISGTAAWTEDDDTISASGAETIAGTLAWVEDDDTISASGAEAISGTSSWTEADDVIAMAGAETVTGTASWTEDDDVWLASGGISLAATIAWTEADDILAASGGESLSGTLSFTEDDDVWAFAGTSAIPGPITVGETLRWREPSPTAWMEQGRERHRDHHSESYSEPGHLTAREPTVTAGRDL